MSAFKPNVPEELVPCRLCVTGFSGYVGRHLLHALHAADIRPILIPRPNRLLPATERAQVLAPWADASELAVQLERLDDLVILNIAGHFVSRHAPGDIPALVSGNLEFPVQIFEALRLSGQDRIVNIGTSWEYSDQGVPAPVNLYAQLKASNAKTLAWFAGQSPLRAINLKLNDTYGGKDTRAKLMPMLKSAWREGRTQSLGTPHQPINLLHITDVVEGLLAAAVETGKATPSSEVGEAFLLAEETVTIGALVKMLQDGPAVSLSAQFMSPETRSETLRGIWENAPRLPHWKSRVSLRAGIEDYFREDK